MNVKELIRELEKIQKDFDENHKQYYDEESPDIRIQDFNDLENKWITSIDFNYGSGYEQFTEVVINYNEELNNE